MKKRWMIAGAATLSFVLGAVAIILFLMYYRPEREGTLAPYSPEAPRYAGATENQTDPKKWDLSELAELADDRPHETIVQELREKYGWPADFEAPLDVEFQDAPEVPAELLGPPPPIKE
jgi:hypothetical protein